MTLPADLSLENLSGLLRELADILGLPATYRLVDRAGGLYLSIPRDPAKAAERLLPLLEDDKTALHALCYHFGGERIPIPKADSLYRRLRNQAIRAEFAAGVKPPDLARRYRLTLNTIYVIVRPLLNDNCSGALKLSQLSLELNGSSFKSHDDAKSAQIPTS
jgi:hypothetical protein